MPAPAAELQTRLELAVEISKQAGALTLGYFQRERLAVDRKADRSPVTDADRGAERLLRERLSAQFPADGILGEEFPEQPGDSEFRWILDPIDGTKSFISGVPLYGTLIGIEQAGQCAAGVIYLPALGEGAYAARGGGAWHWRGDADPQPARVAETAKLSEGLLSTSSVEGFLERGSLEPLADLQAAAWFTRTWGDCYGYLLVATGRAAAMIDPEMSLWDTAALLPIIVEAGGRFTDWAGAETVHSGEAVATNGRVHQEVLAITSRYPKRPAR